MFPNGWPGSGLLLLRLVAGVLLSCKGVLAPLARQELQITLLQLVAGLLLLLGFAAMPTSSVVSNHQTQPRSNRIFASAHSWPRSRAKEVDVNSPTSYRPKAPTAAVVTEITGVIHTAGKNALAG